jgi:parallel beta-helix repeat protein
MLLPILLAYHVAMTGDDAAAGSDVAPFRTIQHAADVAAPGDTVTVHAGTYVGFIVTTVATEAAPLAFVADGAVAIDGAATANQDAIEINGGAWIRIEGFTVTHATRAGISALDCNHITIRGNHVDQNGKWGVFSGFCEDFVVENNELSRSGTQHGVYASNSADRPVIRNNLIWGNAQCGVHINGDISQGGDGVISGAVVEGNVIHDNGALGGSGINGDGITGAVIRNNVTRRALGLEHPERLDRQHRARQHPARRQRRERRDRSVRDLRRHLRSQRRGRSVLVRRRDDRSRRLARVDRQRRGIVHRRR